MHNLSIVTINRNNAGGLRRTLESVAIQRFKCFEYMVIDGNSTDHSIEVIKEFSEVIDYSVSELDNGIYDAMLKGIQRANGRWIWFLNSGDVFAYPTAAKDMAAFLSDGIDIFYGDYLVQYQDGQILPTAARDATKERIWMGMPTSHQACVFARDTLAKVGFNTNHGFAADYGQISQILTSGGIAKRVSICPVIVEAGGVSDSRRLASTLLHARIALGAKKSSWVSLYWGWKLVDQCIRLVVKTAAPQQLVRLLRRFRARPSDRCLF